LKPAAKPQEPIAPLRLVLIPIAVVACFALVPFIRENPRLAGSFLGASAALFVAYLILRARVRSAGRMLGYDILPRPVHYVQLCMHSSIYLYWGWYWREVYHYFPLILGQIAYVYALDMLVCWSRRDRWVLGFGPFPIVLSTNLFLWFKDDWFFLQFLLVSTGVLCKEFITWKREGRRVHIFNPSAIALAVFSVILIATHSTHISWGEEVAVTLGRPPNIYIEIFLVGLVVQALFSVTLVTLAAGAALFLLNTIYTKTTGVYFFVDSNIPAAVFLGLHLLVTDPATSPRRSFGKVIFGFLYGALVFVLYAILGAISAPTFYDKLLCVPPLNLTVRVLDRWSLRVEQRFQWFSTWTARQANFAHMGVWIALFTLMAGSGFVGPHHPGANADFWRQACADGKRNACQTWVRTMDISCEHGSARACFTLAGVWNYGKVVARDADAAGKNFGRGCDLSMSESCAALISLVGSQGPDVFLPACNRGDGESCFVLASLYYIGRGVPRDYGSAVALFRQACDAGWYRGCGGLAECYRAGRGTGIDSMQAIDNFEKACRNGIAASCYSVAQMYRARKDEALARERFRQACDLSTHAATAGTAYFRASSASSSPAATPMFCKEAIP